MFRLPFNLRGRALLLPICAACMNACNSLPERRADLVLQNGHSGGSALAASPDSRRVAAGAWNGIIRLWRLPDGTRESQWPAHGDSVNGIVFLGDGDGGELLSGGYDGRMAVWTLQGRLLRQWDSGSPITALRARSDRALVATGHADGTIRLWNEDGAKLAEWAAVHRGRVRTVALSDEGGMIASSGVDGRVYWWMQDGSPQRLDDPPSDARTLLFQPDTGDLVGAGWFRLFRWTLPGGALRTLPTEHRGIINEVQFLPDGRLASISRQTDSAVLLLDATSGETLVRFAKHDLCGVAVEPTADGRFLATTSDDASVRIWRLQPEPVGRPVD